jgi:hypothetical protein
MPRIEAWLEQGLLQAIEDSGKPRDQVSLLEICESAPGVFGDKGDSKRRAIQVRFCNLKRKSIRSWAAYLDKNEIAHGAATTRLLREQAAQPSPESLASEKDEENLSSEDETEDETPSATTITEDEIASATTEVEPAALVPPSSPKAYTPSKDILGALTSAFNSLSVKSPAPFKALSPRKLTYLSPPPATFKMQLPPSLSSTTEESSFEGSKLNPFIQHVNSDFPERNREFDIHHMDTIEHGDFDRSGYNIRVKTYVTDGHLWSAQMYNGAPGYEDRAILIKGPSRDATHGLIDEYHRKLDCVNTKDAHSKASIAISHAPERQVSYWLLLFKEGVKLDNVVFAGDPIFLKKQSIGLKDTIKERDFLSTYVQWRIADKDAGYRKVAEKIETMEDLYD